MAWKKHSKAAELISSILSLFGRLLIFPIPTIAVLNGHAFGAGLFVALACDWRFQRKDRGFLNFPKVNLGLPLSGFSSLVTKLPKGSERLVLTGERIAAPEALRYGIVDFIETEENIIPAAIKHGASISGKNRANYTVLKRELWPNIYDTLVNFQPQAPKL